MQYSNALARAPGGPWKICARNIVFLIEHVHSHSSYLLAFPQGGSSLSLMSFSISSLSDFDFPGVLK